MKLIIGNNGNRAVLVPDYFKKNPISEIVNLLKSSGLTWWLDFGQLLSLHRSGNPLEWKDDWDFCIVRKNRNDYLDFISTLKKISTRFFQRGETFFRIVIGDYEFDFYCCEIDYNTKTIKQIWNPGIDGYDMKLFFYDELGSITWNGINFNVPRHLDLYLKIRYGEDWRTPVKKDMRFETHNVGKEFQKESYTCLIAGIFDGLHIGHQNLINWGIKHFDKIIIGVTTDELVNYKEKPTNNYEDRIKAIKEMYPDIEILYNCPLVTDKILLDSINCDWVMFGREKSFSLKKFYPDEEINHTIDRYPVVSSRLLRNQKIKSFCINLESREDRYLKVLNQLGKINIFTERFSVKKHNIQNGILKGVSDKVNQILESHLQLYKHLLILEDEYFLILEDDVIVIREVDLDKVIESAPKDWDVIYLGGLNHYRNPVAINSNFYRAKFSFNAHAFIVKKSFLPTMIESLEKRELECDVILAHLQNQDIGNWYGLFEDVIIQNGKESPTTITAFDKSYNLISKLEGQIILKKADLFIEPEIEFQRLCLKLTPFLPKVFPKINKYSKKKSLIVETRNLPHLEFVIKNTIQKLGDGWGHIIYCHKNNYDTILKICSEISPQIEIRFLDYEIDRNSYNNLCLDIKFWNQINCEKVLIYQTDTFICNQFDNDFLKYDYIGAPWGPSDHSNYLKEKLNLDFGLLIGNGGLSIRDVTKTKNCLLDNNFIRNLNSRSTDPTLDRLPEDIIFSLYFTNKNYPSHQRSIDFSCEFFLNLSSFGFHKPWNIFNNTSIMTKELEKIFFLKNKKRILFITHEESLTGAPIVLKNLIDYEKNLGEFDVWCISLEKYNCEWDINQKIYYQDIPGDTDFQKAKYIQEVLNPDFVYANSMVSSSFARHFTCYKLISIHEYRSLIPELNQIKDKIGGFDKVIVVCEPTQNLLKKFDVESTLVPQYLNYDNLVSQKTIKEESGLIIGAGNAQYRKGLHRFIELAEKIPNKKFIWIGCLNAVKIENNIISIDCMNFLNSDFELGEEIKEFQIQRVIPENVKFIGIKSQVEVCELISVAECFLMLSTDDPFPLVVNEAKISNTRVVTLKESGDSYKICDNHDLILEKYDSEKIVRYLNSLRPKEKNINFEVIDYFKTNLEKNREQYLEFLHRKIKVFLAIDSNSQDFSYQLLEKSIISLQRFGYDIKVITDVNDTRLQKITENCEVIIFNSEIENHIREKVAKNSGVTGAYYTLEIPRICVEKNYHDKFVLYCDYDIICNKDFSNHLPLNVEYLAAAPEWKKYDMDYFNTGIVWYNVKNSYTEYEKIKEMVLNNKFIDVHDQSVLNEVFKGRFTLLNNKLNWKPYWGITTEYCILHFHWLKPHRDLSDKELSQKIDALGEIIDIKSTEHYFDYWRNFEKSV